MTFFALVIIGLVYIVVINGTFLPIMQGLVNSDSVVPMDAASKESVLSGFTHVNLMMKFLIPALFLAALVAVIVFIFFKREEESMQG